jgi:hypothetical protein
MGGVMLLQIQSPCSPDLIPTYEIFKGQIEHYPTARNNYHTEALISDTTEITNNKSTKCESE